MSSFENALNISIEPKEIIEFVKASQKAIDEGHPVIWASQIAFLLDHYPRSSPKITAIIQRVKSLESVMKHDRMRDWIGTPEDVRRITPPKAVLHATALAPLYVSGGQAHFDPEEFFLLLDSDLCRNVGQ